MARNQESKKIRWRLWLGIISACVVLAVVIYTGRRVRHFVISDPRFTLASPDARGAGLSMEGLAHSSRSRVLATFKDDFGRSVFLVPIAERRRRLLAVDWVEDASIARIWPNRVTVRIKERKPVAFVNLSIPGTRGSRVLLIDARRRAARAARAIAFYLSRAERRHRRANRTRTPPARAGHDEAAG